MKNDNARSTSAIPPAVLAVTLSLVLGGCATTSMPFRCDAPPPAARYIAVDDPVPDQYIVVMEQAGSGARSLSRDAAEGRLKALGATNVRSLDSINGFVANLGRPTVRELLADPAVLFIQQDGRKSINREPPWGLDRVDQRDLPLDNVFAPGNTGAGVHAYVIDTGIDAQHPDFAGRLGECHSVIDNGNCTDGHGHGTHVAGTIGGTKYGVAKGVTLHAVRVLDANGGGTDSGVIAGIDWVTSHVQQNGWKGVANMSLGGGKSEALDRAVCRSVAAGVVHVVAGGNDQSDACNGSPARGASAITLGATGSTDRRASFSNVGACLSLFAPGELIESAWPGGGKRELSGTSMASPHAAGVAALCLERTPNADIKACVVNSATPGKVGDARGGSPNLMLYARPPQ